MEVKYQPLKERIKGDLSVVLQKDKFQRFYNQNQNLSKNGSLQPNTLHSNKDRGNLRPNTTSDLPEEDVKSKINQTQRKKTKRKNSQVSIVQDFLNEQKQPIQYPEPQNQRYTIKVANCPRYHYTNGSEGSQKCGKLTNQTEKQSGQMKFGSVQKDKNIRDFFQYILEFKLMNVDSYTPKDREFSVFNIDSFLSPRASKSSKNHKVHFQQENYCVQNQQLNTQINGNKQKRTEQLQVSQISMVDVRISNTSFDDLNTPVKNKQRNESDNSRNQMKKTKKVFFDFQNPNQTSLDQADDLNNILQSSKFTSTNYKSESKIVSFNELKKRVQNIQQQAKNYVHHGYFCDECKVDPIIGRRYRCLECEEYDLCEKCYQNQCSNFKMIMNRHQRQNSKKESKFNWNNMVDMSPMMKKKMSDIKQEDSSLQIQSSEEGIHVSSQNDTDNNEHVHLMQEVLKQRPQFQVNLQKVLTQTNRFTNDTSKIKTNYRNSQKPLRRLSPLTPKYSRASLISNIGNNASKIAFSERTIPIGALQSPQRRLLHQNLRKIEILRKETASMKNILD